VLVVEDGVGDAGLGHDRWDVRLPHALREPCAERPLAEHGVHAIGERADLPDGIAARDADEDRLVVATREELDLTAANEVREITDDIRTVPLEPVEERTGEVEGRFYFGVPVESGHERCVCTLCHFGEDVWEVPSRLVLVENQRQSQAIGQFQAFYRR
jgi:hypothetical protein